MIKRTLTIIVFIIFVAILTGCAAAEDVSAPAVQNGLIDLSGWSFQEQGNVRLDGKWAFYWRRFLDPKDIDNTSNPDTYIQVPSVWNGTVANGEKVTGKGYATYFLHVKTSFPEGSELGLRLFTMSSAYRLYIDGTLVAQNGLPSENEQGESGEYRPQVVYFSAPNKEFDITVHVSNHIYARGGFWYSVILGTAQKISSMHEGIMQKEAFIMGALVIIVFLYLALFVMRREFSYLLCFIGFSVSLLFALSLAGQLSILRILPPLSLKTIIILWYSSDVWMFFFLYLFIHRFYQTGFSRLLAKLLFVLTLAQQIAYLCTPVYFFSQYFAQSGSIFNIIVALGAIAVIFIGIKRKQPDGFMNLVSIFVATLCYIHDELYWMNIINPGYGEVHHFGLLFFLFVQLIVQAKRIRRDYEKQSATELAFWQAQIKPHFLFNALNTFISISYYDMDRARELLNRFADYLRLTFNFKNASLMVVLKSEIELAKTYTEIEKARFEERIAVNFDVCEDTHSKVPLLMLQPIIENAINHGLLPKREGGRVDVSIKREGKSMMFCVSDNGVGMDERKLEAILSAESQSGIGLYNINERLKRLYGKGLVISSVPGAGTQVRWTIPLDKKGSRQ